MKNFVHGFTGYNIEAISDNINSYAKNNGLNIVQVSSVLSAEVMPYLRVIVVFNKA